MKFAYVAVQDDFYIRKVPVTDYNIDSFLFAISEKDSNIFDNESDAIKYLNNIADYNIEKYTAMLNEWKQRKDNFINIIEE